MTLPPRLRKVVLTLHVTTSVGWLGAVAAYLALDVAAVTSENIPTVRGAYLAMALLVRYVIVPLALAAVVVGVLNALGTPWGLFRHYWVLLKLLLTLLAAGVLLQTAPSVGALADLAATTPDPRQLPGTLLHSIGGLGVLLTTAVLSVFKPRGLTRYGWRRQRAGVPTAQAGGAQ